MKKPITFLIKVLYSVFSLIVSLFFLVIYISIHFFWYFRFPSRYKISVLLMESDYEPKIGWSVDHLKNNNIPLEIPMVSVWPTAIHAIWDIDRCMMTLSNYESKYSSFVFFESKKKIKKTY